MTVVNMDESQPANFTDSRLDVLARRIQAAQDRICRGGEEWIEGTLDLARALLAGRQAVPANVAFSAWLKQRKLNFYNKNDRIALLNLAGDLDLARKILQQTTSRSYRAIWHDYQQQKAMNEKALSRLPRPGKTNKKRQRMMGRAMLHRSAKLGDALLEQIKGTTLDNAKEMDELVMLNRGAPAGELTETVRQLVSNAVAGKPVSACAHSATIASTKHKEPDLNDAWNKRMVFAWQMASWEQQGKLVDRLISEMKGKPNG